MKAGCNGDGCAPRRLGPGPQLHEPAGRQGFHSCPVTGVAGSAPAAWRGVSSWAWRALHGVPVLGSSAGPCTSGHAFDRGCSFAGDHEAEAGKTPQTGAKNMVTQACY